MAQTWNKLLNFIKREMGANINFLEMSDDDIVEGLRDDVIPYFSQYVPAKKIVAITPEHIISSPATKGGSKWSFKIPKLENEQIIDVYEALPSRSYNADWNWDMLAGTKMENGQYHAGFSPSSGYAGMVSVGEEMFVGENMINTVIANYYSDMQRYLSVRNTWEFIPPDIVTFDVPTDGGLVIYHIPHKYLETIPPDMYEKIFKKLCLGKVQRWIAALRSKYETITTQLGEVKVNWQKLETDSEKNITEAQQLLDIVPLDRYLEIG